VKVPSIFDFNQRTIKPRRDAFDKCSVFEFKNPALLLAFAFQDIKYIKRAGASRIQTASRPCATAPAVFQNKQSNARRADFDNRTEGTGSRVAPPRLPQYKSKAVHAEERCTSQ